MQRDTRPISWVKAARRQFEKFPLGARERILQALVVAAEGRTAGIAKPMTGLGAGVYEVALLYRGDAYRAVYTVQFRDRIWVVHAFQKKSKTGVKTPQADIDAIRGRIKRLVEHHE
jgi:phage-related protein